MSTVGEQEAARLRQSVSSFNVGDDAATLEQFAPDVTFVVPGHSVLAGTYRGREELGRFFRKLHELSGGTFQVSLEEVLSNEHRLVLFMHFIAERPGQNLNVLMAGFHDDRGPDGWRRATFLPDDLAAFDRFFAGT
ncbi:MAG: nuclear transport factor 2 family protein [Actinomycetota bacterium]